MECVKWLHIYINRARAYSDINVVPPSLLEEGNLVARIPNSPWQKMVVLLLDRSILGDRLTVQLCHVNDIGHHSQLTPTRLIYIK